MVVKSLCYEEQERNRKCKLKRRRKKRDEPGTRRGPSRTFPPCPCWQPWREYHCNDAWSWQRCTPSAGQPALVRSMHGVSQSRQCHCAKDHYLCSAANSTPFGTHEHVLEIQLDVRIDSRHVSFALGFTLTLAPAMRGGVTPRASTCRLAERSNGLFDHGWWST